MKSPETITAENEEARQLEELETIVEQLDEIDNNETLEQAKNVEEEAFTN